MLMQISFIIWWCHRMLFALGILCSQSMMSIRTLPQFCSPLLSLITFLPGLLLVFKVMLYQPSFCLIVLLQKIIHFQHKTNLSFFFPFLILLFSVYMFLRGFFHSSTIMKLQIASYHIFIAFYLTPHQIIWHNKTIHRHGLKITSCCFFFFISEETKFHVDTTSIVLSHLYHFGNVNWELFWYY